MGFIRGHRCRGLKWQGYMSQDGEPPKRSVLWTSRAECQHAPSSFHILDRDHKLRSQLSSRKAESVLVVLVCSGWVGPGSPARSTY